MVVFCRALLAHGVVVVILVERLVVGAFVFVFLAVVRCKLQR